MQFHSDRFTFNPTTMRLKNNRPGTLPNVSLVGSPLLIKYYDDVKNVLTSFKEVSIVALDSLKIEGIVTLNKTVLKESVTILNRQATQVNLTEKLMRDPSIPKHSGRPVLNHITLEIDTDGKLNIL